MTSPLSNPGFNDPSDGALPPELAALAADLDRLAAAEARSAGPTLEDRLHIRTRAAAAHEGMTPEVRRVDQRLAAVAADDVASAPANLEDRVFNATVDALRGAPAVAGVIGRPAAWTRRVAVAAGLLLAAAAGYVALTRTGPATTDPTKAIAANTTPDSANADPTPVKVAADDLDRYVNTSDAEASFAALFAMNVDPLESDIRTATQEAARLDKALSAEPAAEAVTSGG